MVRAVWVSVLSAFLVMGSAYAQDVNQDGESESDAQSEAENAYQAKLRELDWVKGPTTVTISENSKLQLPDHYVFLDARNTAKFEELNQNLSSGKEVMIAPDSLEWSAYFVFEGEGYVKDDEKIDADAILKALRDGTEQANEERERRGWAPLHVTGWSIPPAYNNVTKRLEWATSLESQGNAGTNFFTKVLGRRGYTSIVLVASPDGTRAAVADLNRVLEGYKFNSGEAYAEWVPGDKVAEYGLAGLIVGGAAAAAVKTGLFKGLWKFILIGGAVVLAGVRKLFGGKKQDA
jgi:uncharacterized membrane-anchored protein